LETSDITVKERAAASKKLQASDAEALLNSASKLIAIKGKKISTFKAGKAIDPGAIDAMLGPTGNLRAPTIRVGKTLIVGFDQEVLEANLL
jgi:hypothetical protein|tara:strand:- start:3851 stop:4123 length:273 start_codon:yes stop_codon:yes gene_type:complete